MLRRLLALSWLCSLLGCTPTQSAHGTPEAPTAIPVAETPATPAAPDTSPPTVWSYSKPLGAWIPVSAGEQDALEVESPHIVSLEARPVWLDLEGEEAGAQLSKIQAPVSIKVFGVEREVLEAVERVARKAQVEVSIVVESEDCRALELLEHVRGLTLFSTVQLDPPPDLSKLTRLERLSIHSTAGNIEPLLANLNPALKELEVAAALPDSALPHVLRLTQLESLRLTEFNASAQLVSLPELKTLAAPVTEERLIAFAKMPKLESLEATNCDLTDAAAEHFAKLQSLKELKVPQCRLGEKSMRVIAALPHLESLQAPVRLSPAAISALRGAKHMQHLRLYVSEFAEVEPELPRLPGLEALILYRSRVPDSGAKTLAKLTQLEELDLHSAELSRDALLELSTLEKLRVLNARGTGVDNEVISKWSGSMKQLRDLDVAETHLTDSAIAELIKFTQLRSLRLPPEAITARSLPLLAKLSLLEISVGAAEIGCNVVKAELSIPVMNCLDASFWNSPAMTPTL